MKHSFYTVYYTKDEKEDLLQFDTYEQAYGIYLMLIENKCKAVDLRKVIVDDNDPCTAHVIKLDTHVKEPTIEELRSDPRWGYEEHIID